MRVWVCLCRHWRPWMHSAAFHGCEFFIQRVAHKTNNIYVTVSSHFQSLTTTRLVSFSALFLMWHLCSVSSYHWHLYKYTHRLLEAHHSSPPPVCPAVAAADRHKETSTTAQSWAEFTLPPSSFVQTQNPLLLARTKYSIINMNLIKALLSFRLFNIITYFRAEKNCTGHETLFLDIPSYVWNFRHRIVPVSLWRDGGGGPEGAWPCWVTPGSEGCWSGYTWMSWETRGETKRTHPQVRQWQSDRKRYTFLSDS